MTEQSPTRADAQATRAGVFMTRRGVAEALGVHEKTVSRWLKSGRLIGHRIGRDWRIHPAEYQAFLDATCNVKQDD